jgi:hypothetical protein
MGQQVKLTCNSEIVVVIEASTNVTVKIKRN